MLADKRRAGFVTRNTSAHATPPTPKKHSQSKPTCEKFQRKKGVRFLFSIPIKVYFFSWNHLLRAKQKKEPKI